MKATRVLPHVTPRVPPYARQRGVTLIEVLIALAIVAIALAAALRAVGSLAATSGALHQRLLAGWSADSELARLELEQGWPDVGTRRFSCAQGALALTCVETVSATPNNLLRRIDVSVYRGDSSERLVQRVTVLADETRRAL